MSPAPPAARRSDEGAARSAYPSFAFDYEDPRTIEGRGLLRADTRDLAALRLERCLAALQGAHGDLLEIGCGAGRNLRAFAHYRPDLRLHGADISERALAEARAAGGPIEYRLGDALALPYPDASFDIVVLFDLLEHVPDVGAAVAEVARVLRPGGVFHGFVPCEGNKRHPVRPVARQPAPAHSPLEARPHRPHPDPDHRPDAADPGGARPAV